MYPLKCVRCSQTAESDDLDPKCGRCGGAVLIAGDGVPKVDRSQLEGPPDGVWRYKAFLPQVPTADVVSLGEGGTPLLRAERLGNEIGLRDLWIKDESRNPTGSFIDRGSTLLLSLARGRGVEEVACHTTGNLGASLAAYCARAGMKAHVSIQSGVDRGKLYQMLAYGAELDVRPGDGTRGRTDRSLHVTAGNPFLLEGEKTTGFEIVEEFGWNSPDVIVVPVGTGGHLSMIWRAMHQLMEAGLVGSTCRLFGVRVDGGLDRKQGRAGSRRAQRGGFTLPELEEAEPSFRKEAEESVAKSGGGTLTAAAGDTIEATGMLASTEGIFAEPSAASVISSLPIALDSGFIDRSERVVCVITGAGLKDTNAVTKLARRARKGVLDEPYPATSPAMGRTKVALLRYLSGRPSYGYELWRLLRARRSISTASVYQHLSELEGSGMVRKKGAFVSKGRERVVYELTARGHHFLKIAKGLEWMG